MILTVVAALELKLSTKSSPRINEPPIATVPSHRALLVLVSVQTIWSDAVACPRDSVAISVSIARLRVDGILSLRRPRWLDAASLRID